MTDTEHPATLRVEVVLSRDPDGGNDLTFFVGGVRIEPEVYEADAGRGWTWADWAAHRDSCFESASSEAVRDALCDIFDEPAGGKYITGRPDDIDWLNTPAEPT